MNNLHENMMAEAIEKIQRQEQEITRLRDLIRNSEKMFKELEAELHVELKDMMAKRDLLVMELRRAMATMCGQDFNSCEETIAAPTKGENV